MNKNLKVFLNNNKDKLINSEKSLRDIYKIMFSCKDNILCEYTEGFKIKKETFLPLLIGQMALCTPFVYLSVLPRLKQMDHQLYEAALDLGCTTKQALWRVIIPQIIPGIFSGFMTAITLSLDDYFISTYTKPATFDTISTYVVNATKGAQTEIKTALWALSTIISVIVVAVTVGMNWMPKKEEA